MSTKIKSKTFAFRCDWLDREKNPDGSTYTTDKPRLLQEIRRRKLAVGDTAIEIGPVIIDFEFWQLISNQKSKVYNTSIGKHQLDYSNK